MFRKGLLAVLALSILTILTYANMVEAITYAVEEGLVSYWSFEPDTIDGDTIKDLFGENHGTIYGGPQLVEGIVGKAMLFDGVDDAVGIPNNATISLSEAFTYEAWANPTVNNGCEGVITKGTWNGDSALATGGEEKWKISIGGVGGSSVGTWGTFPSGAWYHLVMAVDGRGPDKFRLYVDGKLVGSLDSSGHIHDLTNVIEDMFIGFTQRNVAFFTGPIDEARVYNRALTPEEVVINFESRGGIAVDYTSDKLISVWGRLKSDQ